MQECARVPRLQNQPSAGRVRFQIRLQYCNTEHCQLLNNMKIFIKTIAGQAHPMDVDESLEVLFACWLISQWE